MEINKMVIDAHNNAVDKGFHNLEYSILNKMTMDKRFTTEEWDAVHNAFISMGLMLIVSEAAEAMEALRKNDVTNFNEEVADIGIRLGDFSHNYGVPLENEIVKKMAINKERPNKHNKLF